MRNRGGMQSVGVLITASPAWMARKHGCAGATETAPGTDQDSARLLGCVQRAANDKEREENGPFFASHAHRNLVASQLWTPNLPMRLAR